MAQLHILYGERKKPIYQKVIVTSAVIIYIISMFVRIVYKHLMLILANSRIFKQIVQMSLFTSQKAKLYRSKQTSKKF